MSKISLVIKTAKLTEDGILISAIEVIDGISGEHLKIAKLNQEIIDYLKIIEIDVTDYLTIIEAKEKNPSLTKLCKNFKLYK
jgi:hypothetical protein